MQVRVQALRVKVQTAAKLERVGERKRGLGKDDNSS